MMYVKAYVGNLCDPQFLVIQFTEEGVKRILRARELLRSGVLDGGMMIFLHNVCMGASYMADTDAAGFFIPWFEVPEGEFAHEYVLDNACDMQARVPVSTFEHLRDTATLADIRLDWGVETWPRSCVVDTDTVVLLVELNDGRGHFDTVEFQILIDDLSDTSPPAGAGRDNAAGITMT